MRKNIRKIILIATTLLMINHSTPYVKLEAKAISISDEIVDRTIYLVNYNYDHWQPDYKLRPDDLYWLYQCVEAEEGNNDERAKYLAACCVLNRVRTGWGESITEVIFKKNQFAVVKNGRIYSVVPSEETKQAVDKAIMDNQDYWCVGFSYGNLHSWWGEAVECHNGEYFYKLNGGN